MIHYYDFAIFDIEIRKIIKIRKKFPKFIRVLALNLLEIVAIHSICQSQLVANLIQIAFFFCE